MAGEETRGFIIARHNVLGLLLLKGKAKKKKQKPAHFQLPGGRASKGEAATVAAARELWEETGIDVRRQLGRLTALDVRGKQHVKGRYYFSLALNDGDSVAGGVPVAATGSAASASAAAAHPRATSRAPFAVRLSSEHTAAAFELDCSTAVKAVELHSGGKNSQALAALGCCQAASFWETAAAAVAVAPASGAVVGSSERRAGFG